MTETSVKEAICDICGVEVRSGSQFCYNCGSSVTASQEVEEAADTDVVTSSDGDTKDGKVDDLDAKPALSQTNVRRPGAARRRNVRKPIVPREVSWVEPEGVGIRFLLTTILLAILSTSLLLLAFYFR